MADMQSLGYIFQHALPNGCKIRELTIRSKIISYDPWMFGVIKNLPLTYLEIDSMELGMPISVIFYFFDIPTLKHLRIGHVVWDMRANFILRHLRPWQEEKSKATTFHQSQMKYHQPKSYRERRNILRFDRQRTASITTLGLAVPCVDPRVAQLLFLWPARLQEVTLSRVVHSAYDSKYTAEVIGDLLGVRRDTLTKIEIPILGQHGMPDFSSFTNLTDLQVHCTSLVSRSFQHGWAKLCAPRLQKLTIDFSGYGLTHRQAQWLNGFVSTSRFNSTSFSLKEIFLKYSFGVSNKNSAESTAPAPWPLGRLKWVSRIAATHEVLLTYSIPVWYDLNWRFKATFNSTAWRVYGMLSSCVYGRELHVDEIAGLLQMSIADVSLLARELFVSGLVQSKSHIDVWGTTNHLDVWAIHQNWAKELILPEYLDVA